MPRTKTSSVLQSLLDVFTEIDDPRVARTRGHPLVNILTMSLFGALAGADGWEALEDYTEVQEEFAPVSRLLAQRDLRAFMICGRATCAAGGGDVCC